MAAIRHSGLGARTVRFPLVAVVAGGLIGLGCIVPGAQAQGLGRSANGPVVPGPEAGPGLRAPCPMGMGLSDQRFIAAMIPHHQGAIAMAELALRKSRRPEIRDLSQRIKTSQSQEISQMREWYRQWYGGPVPPLGVYGHGPMGMGGSGMGMGMGAASMQAADLTALSQAKDFDRAFITAMISHHRMGVMMAAMAQIHARHPQLLELEQAMVRVQGSEIKQMEAWSRQWFGTP